MDEYLCGAYERLSRPDEKIYDMEEYSTSIVTQIKVIEKEIEKRNKSGPDKFILVDHYTDDGYSGGDYDRPNFKRLIKDIDDGKINCVIVKNLARFGRDLKDTLNYMDKYFPKKGIRFICIKEKYDSNNELDDPDIIDDAAENDKYLRNCSHDVKEALLLRQQEGKYIGSFPIYGYKKNPNDHHKLIIDENVRDNVELMFDMALEGTSPSKIAEYLTNRKIPIPIVYKGDPRGKDVTDNDGYGIWRRQTVTNILTSEMMIGNMVQHTYYRIRTLKKNKPHKKRDYCIVPNTHEAIISKEKFDKVQELLCSKSTPRVTNKQLDYLLGGLLYCKECGRTIRISKDILKSGVRHYTQCNLYTRKGKYGVCSSHRINYDWLEEDIVEHLQSICECFCKNYDLSDIIDNSDKIINENINKLSKKISILQNELSSNETLADNLYRDKVNGIIDEALFQRNYTKTNEEITRLKDNINELEVQRENYESERGQGSNFEKCKKAVISYLSLKNPTRELVSKLIERIEIDKDKNIYVYYKFKKWLEPAAS